MNIVTLSGYLGHDWLIYKSEFGVIARNSIAITKYYRIDGQKMERTDWIPLIAYSKNAENLTQYTHKGDKLLLNGEIITSQYTDKNSGEIRNSFSVKITSFEFATHKPKANEKEIEQKANETSKESEKIIEKDEKYIATNSSDEIPF